MYTDDFELNVIVLVYSTKRCLQRSQHCWLDNRKGIRPVKTSVSKPPGMAVNVNSKYVGYSLKYLWATHLPSSKEKYEECPACPVRMLRIKVTGDWETRGHPANPVLTWNMAVKTAHVCVQHTKVITYRVCPTNASTNTLSHFVAPTRSDHTPMYTERRCVSLICCLLALSTHRIHTVPLYACICLDFCVCAFFCMWVYLFSVLCVLFNIK